MTLHAEIRSGLFSRTDAPNIVRVLSLTLTAELEPIWRQDIPTGRMASRHWSFRFSLRFRMRDCLVRAYVLTPTSNESKVFQRPATQFFRNPPELLIYPEYLTHFAGHAANTDPS